MATPSLWWIINLEALIIMAGICLLLLLYIHRLRRLLNRQQHILRQALEQRDAPSSPEAKEAEQTGSSANAQLQAELEALQEAVHTRDRRIANLEQEPPGGEEKNSPDFYPDTRTIDELQNLRSLAADQHRLIGQLQKQVRAAESAEQKEQVIQDLKAQLQQHLRYMKESETCVALLERELAEVQTQHNHLAHLQATDQETIQSMRAALTQFTVESKDLLERINTLEEQQQGYAELEDLPQQRDEPV